MCRFWVRQQRRTQVCMLSRGESDLSTTRDKKGCGRCPNGSLGSPQWVGVEAWGGIVLLGQEEGQENMHE